MKEERVLSDSSNKMPEIPSDNLVIRNEVRARVSISYHDNSICRFIVKVPSIDFIYVLRDFLKDIKVEKHENLSLEDIIKIDPI